MSNTQFKNKINFLLDTLNNQYITPGLVDTIEETINYMMSSYIKERKNHAKYVEKFYEVTKSVIKKYDFSKSVEENNGAYIKFLHNKSSDEIIRLEGIINIKNKILEINSIDCKNGDVLKYSLKVFNEIVEENRPKYDPFKIIEKNIGSNVELHLKDEQKYKGFLKSVYNDCRGKIVVIQSGPFELHFPNDNIIFLK